MGTAKIAEKNVAISEVYKLSSIACIIPGVCNCELIWVKSNFKKTDITGKVRKIMYDPTMTIKKASVILSAKRDFFVNVLSCFKLVIWRHQIFSYFTLF